MGGPVPPRPPQFRPPWIPLPKVEDLSTHFLCDFMKQLKDFLRKNTKKLKTLHNLTSPKNV